MPEWRPAPFDADYHVSSGGQVRSVKAWRGRPGPRILEGYFDSRGYRRVTLGKDEHKVHQLVALVFHGPRPDGALIRHLDGDQANNAASNLAYGTPSENLMDSLRHGTHPMRSKTVCLKGHPFDAANTGTCAKGYRVCIECRRIRRRAAKQRLRARLRQMKAVTTNA